jgi:multidrug efflux pump subunit AcrA (membrane-fusion protein)
MSVRRSRFRFLKIALVLLLIAAPVVFTLVPQTRPATLALLDKAGLGGPVRRLVEGTPARPATVATVTPVAPAVTVVEAVLRPFRDQLFVSGTLIAREEAMVGAQIDGLRIDAVLAEDGDRVKEGQVLARLDRTQLDTLVAGSDAALARADAAVAQARSQVLQFEATGAQVIADYNRAKQLGLGVISQATLDQRLSLARAAEAQLAGAQGALSAALATRRVRRRSGVNSASGWRGPRSARRSPASSAGVRRGWARKPPAGAIRSSGSSGTARSTSMPRRQTTCSPGSASA